MMRIITVFVLMALIIPVIFFTRDYLKVGTRNIPTLTENDQYSTVTKADTVPYAMEIVAENLDIPWSILFTSPQRMLVAERTGAIRIVENGKIAEEPLRRFPEVIARGESGLMGMTLDPDYAENKYVYTALAYMKQGKMVIKIVRFRDISDDIVMPKIILDDIPAANNHAGTRLKFAQDGKLYITTGDAQDKELAQQMDSFAGKILKTDKDGTGVEIVARGFRNSQGLDWDPRTNNLWAVDHGPSGFDGPRGGDEINLVFPGRNYGWPLVSHENNQNGLEAPKLIFTPAIAPASLIFYRGDIFPQFTGSLFFTGLAGTGVYRAELSDDRMSISGWEKLAVDVGRVRDIIEGPDGYIYFTTSNTDGRGTKRPGDDKIYRLVPTK